MNGCSLERNRSEVKTMLCRNCHKEIKDGAKFCPHCGTRTSGNATNSNIPAEASDTSGAPTRYIIIAASGQPSDVHKLLLDESYPYHLKDKELLRIPVSQDAHSLKWSSSSMSVGSAIVEIEPRGRNIFFKILREKGFLGISKYTIKQVSSVQELACFCQQERMAQVWADNGLHSCVMGDENFCMSYDDRLVVVDKNDARTEVKYADLVSVARGSYLEICCCFNNPRNSGKMIGIVSFSGFRMPDETLEYINSRISELNGDAIYFCRHDKKQGLIVWKDKLVFINTDGFDREFCYESLMLVQVGEKSMRLYSWNRFGYDEIQNLVHFDKKERKKLTEYINGRIAEKHGFYTALIGKECICVVYDDRMIMYGSDGTAKEIEYASIMDVGTAISPQTMTVYHWDNPNDTSEQYNFESLPDKALQYINQCAYKINGTGLYACVHDIDNQNSLLFYEDRFAVIDKDNVRKESSYKELVDIFLDGSIHYWDTSNAIVNIAPCKRGFNWTTELTMEVKKRIQKTRGNDAIEVFGVAFPSDVKRISFEFRKNMDCFHIRRGNSVGPDYPISGIMNYELKTSERAGGDKTSSALHGAVLGGALGGGMVGMLAGASLGRRLAADAKIESIALWMTIKTADGQTVIEKITLFDRKTSTGPVEERITELTMYLDEIISTNKQVAASPSPPNQGTSAQSDKNSAIAELREWKSLLDDGIITEEEFATKKKQIMNL